MAKEQGIPKIWENIENIKASKLGKAEKASDSELLDGHDSSYFARQSDMNNKYDKSGGLIGGNVIMLPNNSLRVRKDSNVPDGEYAMGYVTGSDTFFSGMASSKYTITSNENPKVKVGTNEFTLYHTGNKPTPNAIGSPQIKRIFSGGGNSSRYKRIGTMNSLGTDRGILNCIINGGADYGKPIDSQIKLTFSTRGWNNTTDPSNNLVDCVMTSGSPITRSFEVYLKKGENLVELWIKAPAYNYIGEIIVLSSDRFVFTLDNETSTQPEGLIACPIKKSFNEGNCPILKSRNGWVKFANGLIIQWSHFVIGGNDGNVTTREGISALPISFSNSTYCIIGTGSVAGNTVESNLLTRPETPSSFKWFLSKASNSSEFYIIAIGY